MSEGQACPFQGNLGSKGILFRYGVSVGCAAAAALLTWQIHTGVIAGWMRGFLWIPLFFFFLNFWQARRKTCAFLALQGLQDCPGGVCGLESGQQSQARHTAMSILARSLVFATMTCAALLWFLK